MPREEDPRVFTLRVCVCVCVCLCACVRGESESPRRADRQQSRSRQPPERERQRDRDRDRERERERGGRSSSRLVPSWFGLDSPLHALSRLASARSWRRKANTLIKKKKAPIQPRAAPQLFDRIFSIPLLSPPLSPVPSERWSDRGRDGRTGRTDREAARLPGG